MDKANADSPSPRQEPREVRSETLMNGGRTLTIVHGSERYTLRITRSEKLILTK